MRLSLVVLLLTLCNCSSSQQVPAEWSVKQQSPAIERKTIPILVASDLYFAFDTDEIFPRYRKDLTEVADAVLWLVKPHPDVKLLIVIEGHTDSIGGHNYNLDLSERRAEAAARILEGRGIPHSMIRIVSKGESDPKATNKTEVGRAKNRYVELHLVGLENNRGAMDYLLKRYHNKPDPETFDGFGELGMVP